MVLTCPHALSSSMFIPATHQILGLQLHTLRWALREVAGKHGDAHRVRWLGHWQCQVHDGIKGDTPRSGAG